MTAVSPSATPPRRPARSVKYPVRDLIKLAFHAGQQHSSGEIAEIMGSDYSPGKVRWALRQHGIQLTKRNFDNDVLSLRWKKAETEALTRIAYANDLETAELAVKLLRVLLAEPIVLKNLLDEAEIFDEA